MKTSSIVLGLGVGVAVLLVGRRVMAPPVAATQGQRIGAGLGSIIDGVRDIYGAVRPRPAVTANNAPQAPAAVDPTLGAHTRGTNAIGARTRTYDSPPTRATTYAQAALAGEVTEWGYGGW